MLSTLNFNTLPAPTLRPLHPLPFPSRPLPMGEFWIFFRLSGWLPFQKRSGKSPVYWWPYSLPLPWSVYSPGWNRYYLRSVSWPWRSLLQVFLSWLPATPALLWLHHIRHFPSGRLFLWLPLSPYWRRVFHSLEMLQFGLHFLKCFLCHNLSPAIVIGLEKKIQRSGWAKALHVTANIVKS